MGALLTPPPYLNSVCVIELFAAVAFNTRLPQLPDAVPDAEVNTIGSSSEPFAWILPPVLTVMVVELPLT